jgi:hypothetical protein
MFEDGAPDRATHEEFQPSAGQDLACGEGVQMSELPGAGAGAGASAEPNTLDPAALVPAHLLDGGEVIIFAVKPSLWFIPLKSARWIVGVVLTILVALWVGEGAFPPLRQATVIQAAVALGGARVGLALLQWVSRLYILTNRRIMRVTGIFNIDLFECQLTKIQSTFLSLAWYERVLRIGTISFATAGAGGTVASWVHVNDPFELHERVRAAIHRAQRPGNGI